MHRLLQLKDLRDHGVKLTCFPETEAWGGPVSKATVHGAIIGKQGSHVHS